MKIRFVLENGKRRPLANALGEAMNTEVRYLGAPTFCFEAGGCQLDKDGVLEIPEGVDHGLLLEKLTDAGFSWSRKKLYRKHWSKRGTSYQCPHMILTGGSRITWTNCLPPRAA